jgi:hypothetical protein
MCRPSQLFIVIQYNERKFKGKPYIKKYFLAQAGRPCFLAEADLEFWDRNTGAGRSVEFPGWLPAGSVSLESSNTQVRLLALFHIRFLPQLLKPPLCQLQAPRIVRIIKEIFNSDNPLAQTVQFCFKKVYVINRT